MRTSRSLIMLIALVALLGAPTVLADGDCSIAAPCCSASADNCDLSEDTCSCAFTCGPQKEGCSCTCVKSVGPVSSPNLAFRVNLASPVGFSLNGSDLDLGDVGKLLQVGMNWWVQVDSDVEDLVVGDGYWSGTLTQVVTGIATAAGAQVTVDEPDSRITFHD